MSDTYDWPGGREAILRFGPSTGPAVLVASALFEEANRTRAFTIRILRALAERGIAGALPDLPGTNESVVPTKYASLIDWRSAFAAAVPERTSYVVAIRGGALIDVEARVAGRYHFAPTAGARIVRDLVRTRLASAREGGEAFDPEAIHPPGPPIELAGNYLSRDLIAALIAAEPLPADRVVRLDGDSAAAHASFVGRPLWRAAEPDVDTELAHTLADDIARWITACER